MKWTVLSDNRSNDSRLSTEHGLSVLLETTNEREQCDARINIAERGGVRRSQTERHRILLDTGASDVLIRNAEVLGIDLSTVDYVFISHGHSDHAGGLRYFFARDMAQYSVETIADMLGCSRQIAVQNRYSVHNMVVLKRNTRLKEKLTT